MIASTVDESSKAKPARSCDAVCPPRQSTVAHNHAIKRVDTSMVSAQNVPNATILGAGGNLASHEGIMELYELPRRYNEMS